MNTAMGPNVLDLSSKALDSISLVDFFRQYSFIPMINGELILKQNNLGSSGIVALCSQFPEHLSPLRKLDLSSNKILDAGAKALASFYLCRPEMMNCLQVLHLGFNNITFEGLVAIVDGLKASKVCLQELSLRYNEIGAKGFHYEKAEALFYWIFQNIQSLDLTGNALKDIGVKVICNVFMDLYNRAPNSIKLEKLNLWANDITDDSAESIAMVLRHLKCSLRVLDLSSNNMTTEGVQKVYDACLMNNSIEDISMYGNEVKDRNIFDNFKILAKRNIDNKAYHALPSNGINNKIPVDLAFGNPLISKPPQPHIQPYPQPSFQTSFVPPNHGNINTPSPYNYSFQQYASPNFNTPPQYMPMNNINGPFSMPPSANFPVHPPYSNPALSNAKPSPQFPSFGIPQKYTESNNPFASPPATSPPTVTTTPTVPTVTSPPTVPTTAPTATTAPSVPSTDTVKSNVINSQERPPNPLDQSFVAFDSKQNQLEVKSRTVQSEEVIQISEKQFKEMESKMRQQEKVIQFLQDLLLQKANMKIAVNYQ